MAISIPSSSSTVTVSIIDTTLNLKGAPAAPFWGPPLAGFERWQASGYAFLITHVDQVTGVKQRLVFDLGPPKDWEHDLPPFIVQTVKSWIQGGAEVEVSKYMTETLSENGIELDSINTVALSHLHWDHTGKPSLFPNSTELLIGPGAHAAFWPGFPHNKLSPIMARELEGRKATELSFDSSDISIGGLKAIDYFTDGSLYFLDAPGHMIGHLNALARTSTNPDTFIYMGADSYHHNSILKPNEHTHLPATIDMSFLPSTIFPGQCPGELFHGVHPSSPLRKSEEQPTYASILNKSNPDETPFNTLSQQPDGSGLWHDIKAGRETIDKMKAIDADERIFVVTAHDNSLRDVVDFFPKDANEWKEKGWKEKGRWRFLRDFEKAIELQRGHATL